MGAMKMSWAAVAAATLALSLADTDRQEVEERPNQAFIDLCCLQAKDAEGRKKKELFVHWASGKTKAKFNPVQDCLVTSTIQSVEDEGESVDGKKVWPPQVAEGKPGEEKCVEMMKKYQPYHDKIIEQAKADKEVDDAFRAGQEQNFQNQYNAQMQDMHIKYKEDVAQAAKSTQLDSDALIQNFVDKEKKDGRALTDSMPSIFDVSSVVNLVSPDEGIAGEEKVLQSKSESIPKTADLHITESHKEAVEEVTQKMEKLKEMTKAFKTNMEAFNTEKIKKETELKTLFAGQKEKLKEQDQKEAKVIEELEAAKPKEVQLSEDKEICKNEECCCTIKFAENQVVDTKVPTNFISWDVCQFPEGLKKAPGVMGFKCGDEGYMRSCKTCLQRPICKNGRSSCGSVAETSKP